MLSVCSLEKSSSRMWKKGAKLLVVIGLMSGSVKRADSDRLNDSITAQLSQISDTFQKSESLEIKPAFLGCIRWNSSIWRES